MAKGYYDLREIILGLQNEYQKNVEELQVLKEYTTIIDKRVNDLNFWIRHEKGSTNEIKLLCTFVEKRNKIQKCVDSISQKLGIYIYGKNISEVWKNMGYHYKISGYYNAMIVNEKSFSKQVDKIITSSFVKNIPLTVEKVEDEKVKNHLELDTDTIDIITRKDGELHSSITYYAEEDRLCFDIFSESEKMSANAQSALLQENLYGIKFPRDHFSLYHQALIDKNFNAKKEVIVEPNKENRYMIDNKNKKTVVLKKVKK